MTDRTIFDSTGEDRGEASLKLGRGNWHAYSYGFRRAFEILLEDVERNNQSLDVIVYPMVFLLRHNLELSIKSVAIDARTILGKSQPEESKHMLGVIWKEARELLDEVAGARQAGLDAVEIAVRDFDKVDPKSTAFRYPESLKGAPVLLNVDRIYLSSLGAHVGAALDILDGASIGLSELLHQDL